MSGQDWKVLDIEFSRCLNTILNPAMFLISVCFSEEK